MVENHAVPIATVLVAVRGGANAQARGEEGLAHMLEHLLFRSFGDGAASFGSAAAQLDADFQGTTDLEVVSYYLQLPSANAEAGVRLLGRLVSQAKFAGDDIRAERNVVLDELMRDKADPLAGLRRSVARRLWGDSWHRRDVGGDSLSLMGLTARQLSDAQARLYLPGNSALIVTGDVQPEAMRMAAEQAFGRWMPGGRAAARSPPDPIRPVAAPEVLLIPYGVPDVTVRVAMPGPRLGADTSAAYTASTLFAILDEPSSAFQQQLVGSGLFQRLAASYDGGSDAGEIVFEGWTTAERAIDALRGLMVMVDGLDRHLDIRAQDLAIAARRSEVDAALTFEATAALAPILASWWAQTGLDYYLEYSRRGEAPTADDLRRFAERHVAAQPKVYGVLGPAAAVAAIRDWLATGRPER